jgi:hypothetical protein
MISSSKEILLSGVLYWRHPARNSAGWKHSEYQDAVARQGETSQEGS